MNYLIGIDSGGTHITAQAYLKNGDLAAEGSAGPGNSFLDYPGTVANLAKAIKEVQAQLPNEEIEQILIGVAGVASAGNAKEIEEQLTNRFMTKITVINDAELALINALEGQDGVLVIAGTGSIVYGRKNGQTYRYGGWGQILGDTGSAYKISVRAIKQLLHQYDEGLDYSLKDTILSFFKTTDVKVVVQKVYQYKRAELANLAVDIAKMAEAGNQDALNILSTEASELAGEITGLIKRMGTPYPKKLAFSGSVLIKNKRFRELVLADVQQLVPDVVPVFSNENSAKAVLYYQEWLKDKK